MKKTFVLKNKKRFSGFIMVLIIIITSILLVNTVYGYKTPSYRTLIVREGDTLWDIANKNNSKNDIRKVVYEIEKVNNLNSSEIVAGQELKVPVEE